METIDPGTDEEPRLVGETQKKRSMDEQVLLLANDHCSIFLRQQTFSAYSTGNEPQLTKLYLVFCILQFGLYIAIWSVYWLV